MQKNITFAVLWTVEKNNFPGLNIAFWKSDFWPCLGFQDTQIFASTSSHLTWLHKIRAFEISHIESIFCQAYCIIKYSCLRCFVKLILFCVVYWRSCSVLHFYLKSLQILCFSGSGGDIHGCVEPKRLETEASAGQHVISPNCSPPLDLNFPLPGEKGPACLVKVREVMSRAVLSVRQTESALQWFVGTEIVSQVHNFVSRDNYILSLHLQYISLLECCIGIAGILQQHLLELAPSHHTQFKRKDSSIRYSWSWALVFFF